MTWLKTFPRFTMHKLYRHGFRRLPIRLNADVDEVVQRSSVQSTFNQIFKDLNKAGDLLAHGVPPLNKNRPSKAAVMALKTRI